MISAKFCKAQIDRLEGLPFYTGIGENGYRSLWEALQSEARSEDEARNAVSALLADTCRANSHETNRVPSPGELRIWVQQQRDTDDPEYRPQTCGLCEEGWIREQKVANFRGQMQVYEGVKPCSCRTNAQAS